MAQSLDHPEIQYVQAQGFNSGRPDGKPLWIVIHDMEASETDTRAENTAAYFANPSDGRSVSSHYCADNNSVVQCVRLKDVAWTVGNRPGNNRGINWELAGFASQNRNQWLDQFGRDMFNRMAPLVRSDAAKYGIPLIKRTVNELKAWIPGVTSHNDLRIAFGTTTHTDPGNNFPWDVFLETMNNEGNEGNEMPTQILVRFSDAPTEFGGPTQVWLADRMLMRMVPASELAPGHIGAGGISLQLGPLANNEQVFVSIWSARKSWGEIYPPELNVQVELSEANIQDIANAVVDAMPPIGEVDLSASAKDDVTDIVRGEIDKTKLGS